MDTRFLESLIAVTELGSIVAAARAKSLTPAAISQRIQVLERDLGVRLLDRRANAATPTRMCHDLLPAMRQLVVQAAAIEQAAKPGCPAGVLKIGAISTVLTAFIPGILHQLHTAAPDVELRIEPGSSAALYSALLAGGLDAALIVEPPSDVPAEFITTVLRREPLCLLVPDGYEGHSPEQVFASLPLVAYDPQSWGGQIASRYLRDHNLSARTLCELDGLEAISKLVARGIGASLVPDWPELTAKRPLPDGALYARNIILIEPRSSQRAACLRAFHQALFNDQVVSCLQVA